VYQQVHILCVYILYLCNEKRQFICHHSCVHSSANAEDSVLCVCVLKWALLIFYLGTGGGEERRAGPAHLGQVLCQHEIHLRFHIGLYAHTQGYISYTTIFSLKNQILIEWFCFTQETIYMRNQIWNVSQRTWNPAAKQALGSSWYFVNSLQVNFSDYALMHITVGISC